MGRRALEEKFTRSELIILAWRSQETSAALEKQTEEGKKGGKTGTKPQRDWVPDSQMPANLPDRFFNEDGEVDLRNVTGEEAYRYFSSIGVKLPIINR